MAWASIVIFICWLTSYSNKTMLSLGWVMATKRLRWSTWTGWPSRNVHSSNGNGSFPFTQIVFFSLFLQLTFRTWLWEKGTAYTSRVAVSLLLFMSSLEYFINNLYKRYIQLKGNREWTNRHRQHRAQCTEGQQTKLKHNIVCSTGEQHRLDINNSSDTATREV
jgi:hypothetical protein